MLSKGDLMLRFWNLWLWLVDLWEFVLLLTLGFHPARSIISLQCDSKETCEHITTCLEMYRKSTVGSSLSQLKDLLSNCDALSIAQLTTEDGYNLLQLAVKKGDLEFVEYLLRDRKINPNISKCSLPLHIALNIGSVNMVQLLLTYNAKPQQQAGMCYPLPHVPVYSSHSKFFFVSPSMVCGGSSKDAYQRAIDKDNVLLLQLLLQKKSSNRRNVSLLHYACDIGAMRCIKCLVEDWSTDVNSTDNRGCNAVMHSLLSDIDIIHYLVSQGADVCGISYQGKTVLHKLYSNTTDNIPHMLEKTKLFLALGADSSVNRYDVFRNTALHYLASNYATNIETDIEPQLRQCIGLLLAHNADTLLTGGEDQLPLLTILQCACLNSTNGSTHALTHQPDSKGRAQKLYHIIKLFSQSNLSSIQGVVNGENETVMFYILRMCFDYEELSFLNIIKLLQDNGANINHVAVTQSPGNTKPTKYTDISARSLISVVCEQARLELRHVSPNTSNTRHSLVAKVLETLFRDGLDPNARQIECRTPEQSENVKSLACFSHLIQECHTLPQLILLEEWIQLILQWGANPQLQSYRPEPQICTSQGSIFLKQASALPIMEMFADSTCYLWSSYPGAMMRIVRLLANSMSQTVLTQSINATSSTILTALRPATGNTDLSNLVLSLTSQPRTLQELASFQIYTSMDRVVCPERVNILPIPTLLKKSISQRL